MKQVSVFMECKKCGNTFVSSCSHKVKAIHILCDKCKKIYMKWENKSDRRSNFG